MVLQSAEGLARAAVERAQDLVELAAAKMRLAALSGLTMLLCVMVAVRRIALRADVDLRQLDAARDRLVADIRGTLTAPLALIGCFVGGVVVGGRGNLGGGASRRRSHRPARAVLRALVLSAPAYRAFVGLVVGSPHAHRDDPSDNVARWQRR